MTVDRILQTHLSVGTPHVYTVQSASGRMMPSALIPDVQGPIAVFPLGVETDNVVHGTAGNDFVHLAGDGNVPPPGYTEFTTASNGDDDIDGRNGDDIVFAGHGNDHIVGGVGSDTLHGEGDNDTLEGGINPDVLDGGNGIDTATYTHSAEGVSVDLGSGANATGGDAAGDHLFNIENLVGSASFDVLVGDGGGNQLEGRDEADTLFGLGSIDKLYGGGGNDLLNGGSAGDTLDGGADSDIVDYAGAPEAEMTINLLTGVGSGGDAEGDTYANIENVNGGRGTDIITGTGAINVFFGYKGDDFLTGGGGADSLDGAGGKDTVTYVGDESGVTANLATGVGSGGDAAGDTYIRIENLIGGIGADHLTGDNGKNQLAGGAGPDTLTGGGEADRFVYTSLDDSLSLLSDLIVDFSHSDHDKIDLSAIDANVHQSGDQAFFIVMSFMGMPGQLVIVDDGHDKVAQGDVDGDNSADITIRFSGPIPSGAADFIL